MNIWCAYCLQTGSISQLVLNRGGGAKIAYESEILTKESKSLGFGILRILSKFNNPFFLFAKKNVYSNCLSFIGQLDKGMHLCPKLFFR